MSFAQWYVTKLKKHPMRTNMGSALVLMLIGDLMAQEIENHSHTSKDGDDLAVADNNSPSLAAKHNHHSPREKLENHRLNFRRYGTLSPDVDSLHLQQMIRRQSIHVELQQEEQADDEYISLSQMREAVKLLATDFYFELKTLDLFRTGTMVFWTVAAYAPFYVTVYKLFDRYLPSGVTAVSVLSRTGLSFLISIPLNAAFFSYGSFIHHLTEWLTLLQETHYKYPETAVGDLLSDLPFDFDMAWGTARLKLEAELWTTVKTSACLWVPINLLNFSAVPPHLRPVILMTCSAFWNCYLSLAQHRPESW